MNATKISCILALTAIILFIIVVAFSEKGDAGLSGLSDLKWVLPLLLVIAIIVIVGFIFSITAIIKERTVLSWICFIIYLLPVTIIPVINYLQKKASYAAPQYDSPQSQKRREKMYENYNLPDSLDISVRNKFVSANIVDDHYPILSVVNYGDGFWYFLGQEAQIGGHSRFTSFAAMIESDKSVVPLLTTLPAMHYATRKDTKSPWVIGEYHRPSAANEEDNK